MRRIHASEEFKLVVVETLKKIQSTKFFRFLQKHLNKSYRLKINAKRYTGKIGKENIKMDFAEEETTEEEIDAMKDIMFVIVGKIF